MVAYLRPVSDALVSSARRSADELISASDADALSELTRARAEADRLVAEARSQGESAARWMAELQLAEARRQAREMILGARRRAYETLRRESLAALERHARTPEGRKLAERLESVVGDRIGAGASVSRTGSEFYGFEARSHDRRAVVGPMLLVDHVIMSMTDEVQELWA